MLKMYAILLIILITLFSGMPALNRAKGKIKKFQIGEALASGIFLGAGLIHMLGSASRGFSAAGVVYPWAFVIAGAVFLVLLLLEHLMTELSHHGEGMSAGIAIVTAIMLSIHSLLAGAALGLSVGLAATIMMLVAIVAHKWAASFALAVQLNRSVLGRRAKYGWFFVFAVMAPLGVLIGQQISVANAAHPLLPAIFMAMAAGTFIFIGTLHGLARSPLIKECCDLKKFAWVVVGFVIMALIA